MNKQTRYLCDSGNFSNLSQEIIDEYFSDLENERLIRQDEKTRVRLLFLEQVGENAPHCLDYSFNNKKDRWELNI